MKARTHSRWRKSIGQIPPLCPGGLFERRRGRWMLRRGRWMLRRADEVQALASGWWRLTRRWERIPYNADYYEKR